MLDTRDPAVRHARGPGRGAREEAGRAAVRDAAAVHVAGVRPGGRHRAPAARRSTASGWSSSTRRSAYDNDTNKGLRPPLEAFKLETEPWLFVLDKSGKITTRLEGSFGLREFEDAIKTGL